MEKKETSDSSSTSSNDDVSKTETDPKKKEFTYSANNGKISNNDVHKTLATESSQGTADLAEMELKLNSLKKEH